MDYRSFPILQSPQRIISSSNPPNLMYSPSGIIRSPMRTIQGQTMQQPNVRILSPKPSIPFYSNKITSPVQTINIGNSQILLSSPSKMHPQLGFINIASQENELEQRFMNCVNRSRELLATYGYTINEKPDLSNVDINELYERALKRSQETLVRYSETIDKKEERNGFESKQAQNLNNFPKPLFEFLYDEQHFIYDGEMQNGRRHGYGVLKNEAGEEIYAGEWENDQLHGKGRLMNLTPEKMEQDFDFKNFEELGNFWLSYEGDFRGNLFDGMGDLRLTNEEKFVGKFEKSTIHGEGCFYRKNGDMELGQWENNRLVKDL